MDEYYNMMNKSNNMMDKYHNTTDKYDNKRDGQLLQHEEQALGVYILVRNYFYPPPPSENDIFSLSRDTSFFNQYCGLFSLILPCFAFILPFYFPFSLFLSAFFFSFPLIPFYFTFSPFSLPFFIFFPPNNISWYPYPLGNWYFPICRPLASSKGQEHNVMDKNNIM